MPGGTNVSASALRTLGLDSLFQDHYSTTREMVDQDIKDLFMVREAKNHQIQFAALFDNPVPELWAAGSALPMESMNDYSHTITVKKYAKGIPWAVDDEEDDQLDTLPARVQELAGEFAHLPIRAGVDLITGTAALLDTVPTAYDGSALHVTSTRFGVSGGNTITGTGTATSGAIRTDFFSAKARLKAFKRNTATGENFWTGDLLDDNRNYLLVFSADAAVEQNAKHAFGQEIMLERIAGTSTTDTSTAASGSNLLATNQPRLKFWARLSGSDWFLFYTGSPSRKPFVLGERHKAPILKQFNDQSSDWAREYDRKAEAWKQRLAVGIFAPETTVKIDN